MVDLHKDIQNRALRSTLIWAAVKGVGLAVFLSLFARRELIIGLPLTAFGFSALMIWIDYSFYYRPNMEKHIELTRLLGSPYLAEVDEAIKTKRLNAMLRERWFIKRFRQQWSD